MREKLSEMTELVQRNLAGAQAMQKQWYDRTAESRKLKAEDQVVVLLPSISSKLLAQWHGPYWVICPGGQVNYLVDVHDRQKKGRVLHINMLKKWHTSVSTNYLAQVDRWTDDDEDSIPTWKVER